MMRVTSLIPMYLYWCIIPTGDSGLRVEVTAARCCFTRVYLIKDGRDLRCTGRGESEQQPWFDLDLSLTEEAEWRGSDRRWCYWTDGLWGCAVPLSRSEPPNAQIGLMWWAGDSSEGVPCLLQHAAGIGSSLPHPTPHPNTTGEIAVKVKE